MTPQITIYITFGVYMVFLLGIGIWADRRYGGSYEGFISADKSLGAWVAAISSAASSESAWVMLGLSGLGYKHGLASYWAAAGCSAGFLLAAIFVIRQLRRSAAEQESVLTLGDYLAQRLGGGKRTVRISSSLLITFFLLVYVVAQFTGSGKQMQGMNLTSYDGGVWIGAGIIGIYVLIGGYAAVCWSDLVQGLLMVLVMVAFPIIAVVKAGGLGEVREGLAAAGIGSIWYNGKGPTWEAFGFALTYFSFSLGYPGMPHSIIRYITIRDDREARQAAYVTVGYGSLLLFGAATLGIVGRVLMPGLSDAEQILPAFAAQHFNPVISGVILAGISAAIMSTADSQLMMASNALVHDVYHMSVRQQPSGGKTMVRQTRVVIAVLTAVALGLALQKSSVIDNLVKFAWGCLGSAFSPVILCSLYWKRFTWQGAVACIVGGPLIVILWQLLELSKAIGAPQLHGMVPGTILSAGLAILVSLMTQPSSSSS